MEHEYRLATLGWAPYLGQSDTLEKMWLMGRYPVKIQEILADAVDAFEQALIHTGYENPCDFIGSYMVRPIGGTNMWSSHSYGVALDFDYGGDTDGDGDPTIDSNPHLHRPVQPDDFGNTTQLLKHQVEAVEAIRNTDGDAMWLWLGWSIGDTMHFQINVRPQAVEVDWMTVAGTEDDMGYNEWIAGWVKGLAEDKPKTHQEFTRLNTVPAADGGYILEPANAPATVNFWMALLDFPTDPQWRGFFARTSLSTWGR